jgi:hypothetical protein
MDILKHGAHPRHDNAEQRARAEFDRLTREEVSDAIADMKAMGFSDHTIAQATGLACEMVRQILGERRESRP